MDRNEWLAKVQEEILEPEIPICDPHHHLWDRPDNRYLLDELLSDVGSGHNVVSTVFMECMSMYRARGLMAMRPVGETEFVNGIAAMSASGIYGNSQMCASIVGFADLTLGSAVGEVLDAHVSATSRFCGIRHASGWDSDERIRNSHTNPPKGLLAQESFREGFAELGVRGLTFDAWLYHTQIPELTDLAHAFPDQPIIIDHFGGPLGIGQHEGRRDEILAQWKIDITELAKCENVIAKLGGIVMPLNGFGFHKRDAPPTSDEIVDATGDYYLHVIDCFGPNRCMFESNFPVDKQSCSYHVLWNAFKKISKDFSSADKAALHHDTAVRVYSVET